MLGRGELHESQTSGLRFEQGLSGLVTPTAYDTTAVMGAPGWLSPVALRARPDVHRRGLPMDPSGSCVICSAFAPLTLLVTTRRQ